MVEGVAQKPYRLVSLGLDPQGGDFQLLQRHHVIDEDLIGGHSSLTSHQHTPKT
jgi:hypothetical protein